MLAIPVACLDCGRPTRNGSRCPGCARPVEAERHNPARNDRRQRARNAAAVAEHVRRYGWLCPGYGRSPHPSRDLTADHPVALANDGSIDQDLGVTCRGCNARKGAR